MGRYEHVIWDWNGTLLDDAWLALEIINQLLAKRGMPTISAARYREIFGFPLREYCRRLGFDFEQESYEELSDEFIEVYERRRLECRLQPGAVEILAAVKRNGLEQSLLSAYKQQTLEELVAHFGLGEFFEAVIGVDNHYGEGKVERGKRRIAALPHAPGQVVLVGDTVYDLKVSRAMGTDCVLVTSGHQHRQRLEESGARVAGDLQEVGGLIISGSRH